MTELPMDKLIDRIRKMHAKAESAKQLGNEAEAFAFASAVQKLLLKHNLEMTDVEAALAAKEDPVRAHYFHPEAFGFKKKKTRILWSELLAHVVADAHMCGVLPVHKSNQFLIIGTRSNRQACEFMIVFLTRYAEQHSQKDYVTYFYQCRAEGDVTKAQGYKAGWLMGFVARLAERYKAERREIIKEVQVKNPHALVRLKDQVVKVEQIRSDLATGKGAMPRGQRYREGSAQGLEDGAAHGDKVQLKGMGLARQEKGQTLGAGQKLLGGGA